ncbi:MAG: metallophosphoesterase, partial [Betaproteobacteria bacterium]
MLQLYSLVILFHTYIGWRLLPDLPFWGIAALALWLVASTILTPLPLFARRMKRQPLADRIAWAGLIAMGWFSSLLVLTVARDAAVFVVWAMSSSLLSANALHATQMYSAAAVPVLAALLTLIGLINARRRAQVRSVDVPIAGLPASLHGFTIAQISDIHIGTTIKRKYVDAIVDAVNDLDADMIAVTGDLVDGSVMQLSQHAQPMSRLSARYGAYFVTGNHEYYSGAGAWVTELRRLGLRVLMNEHVVLNHKGEAVVVAGV